MADSNFEEGDTLGRMERDIVMAFCRTVQNVWYYSKFVPMLRKTSLRSSFFPFQSMNYDVYRRRVEATGSRKFLNGDPTALDDELDADDTDVTEMMNRVIEKIHGNAIRSDPPPVDTDMNEGR